MVFSCFAIIGGQESQGPGRLREQAPAWCLVTSPSPSPSDLRIGCAVWCSTSPMRPFACNARGTGVSASTRRRRAHAPRWRSTRGMFARRCSSSRPGSKQTLSSSAAALIRRTARRRRGSAATRAAISSATACAQSSVSVGRSFRGGAGGTTWIGNARGSASAVAGESARGWGSTGGVSTYPRGIQSTP